MSFTDEQLLNLVNNTIKTKTEFEINDFTGGSIQITSTNNHQLIKYKVSLFFGYSNRNAISKTFSIKEDFVTIWQKAILLKVKSLQVANNGMDYSELNALMNNLDEVVSNEVVSNEVVSNEVEVVSNGSTISSKMNRTIEFKKEEVQEEEKEEEQNILNLPTNELTDKDFTLSKLTSYDNLSATYKEKLEEFLNRYIEDLELKILNANGNKKTLQYEDFILSLEAKGYKYKNFISAYKTWNRGMK